jgi:hypothetical protein
VTTLPNYPARQALHLPGGARAKMPR